MEPEDIPDAVEDVQDEAGVDPHNRQWVAIFISLLAVVLAITSMGGSNVAKDIMIANIHASDTYAFYQAKAIRQTSYRLAADELLSLKASSVWLPSAAADLIDRRLAAYQATIEKYDSEPETGEGKAELMERARGFEAVRDRAARQDPFFDYAEALLQISIVLASASIVARRRWVLNLSYAFAAIALVLAVNAHTLWFDLPL